MMDWDWTREAVCVTGVTGFIGAAIAERFVDLGSRVKGLDIATTGPKYEQLIRRGVEIVTGSTQDESAVRQALTACTLVIHCAALMDDALPWDDIMAANVNGTRIVAEQAKAAGVRCVREGFVSSFSARAETCDAGIRTMGSETQSRSVARGASFSLFCALHQYQFVFLSSVMVYGFRFEADIDEDGPMDGCGNAYCQSKIDGERLLLPMHDPGRFDVIILRPGDVYGPDSVPWVRTPVRRMRAGQFAVPGPGTGIMNHVYVDNLVDAVLLLVRERARAGGRAFNCTDGARTTWLEYFRRLARVAGCPPPPVLEADTMRQLLALPATDPRRARFDPGQPPVSVDYQTRPHRYSSARLQALGFVPRVDLDAGMRRVADALGRAA